MGVGAGAPSLGGAIGGSGIGVSAMGSAAAGLTMGVGMGMGAGGAPGAAVGSSAGAGAGGLGLGVGGGSAGASAGPDGYGILGLLGVIKTNDRDLNVLAMGTDLTSLSLNLSTAEPLHASFAHPWTDAPAAKEPALTLPPSYRVPQPALKTGHFAKFSSGTLLYIFYAMPRDVLQAYAAQELYAREWRFHRDGKLWFRRAPVAAGAPAPAASDPQAWVYWDVQAWEARPYSGPLPVPQLITGFLPEEEVRVRPAGAAATAASAGSAAGSAAPASAGAGPAGTGGAAGVASASGPGGPGTGSGGGP